MTSQTNVDGASIQSIVLLPCPFCGGEAKAYEYKADKVTFGMVMCSLCGVKGDGESPSKAAEWWNTRVVNRAVNVAIRLAHQCTRVDTETGRFVVTVPDSLRIEAIDAVRELGQID